MTSQFLELSAFAKINLALDVIGKLPNGYHTVEMVMQSLSLADEIVLAKSSQTKIITDCLDLPLDQRNLAFKAWDLMAQTYGLSHGVEIKITKKIPLAGGLAGGSADAAAVILGVNQLFDLQIPKADLASLALRLGADVPFCLSGGTVLAEGIGEKLTPLKSCPKLQVVLINPGFPVETAKVYQNLRWQQIPQHPRLGKLLEAIEAGSGTAVLANLGNVLEFSAFELFPVLAKIKEELAGLGLAALMSGSGGTILGLTEDLELATWAFKQIKPKYPLVALANTQNVW